MGMVSTQDGMTPPSTVPRCNPGEFQGRAEKGFLQRPSPFVVVALPPPWLPEIESSVFLRRGFIRGGKNGPVPDELVILVKFLHDNLKAIPSPGVVVKIDFPCKDIGENQGQL